jgi:FRG domain-containing protein
MTNKNQPEPFSIVKHASWRQTRDLLQQFPVSWVFRGQCDSKYSLVTSVQRIPSVIVGECELGASVLPQLEQAILHRFKRQARNYDLNYVPTDDDALGWLSLLQHHGAPTRLLDWTRSPFVACFFALETARQESAIWAIDHIWLRNRAWAIVRAAWPEEIVKEISSRSNAEAVVLRVLLEKFSGLFVAPPPRFVMPIEPSIANPRVATQHGLFTFQADITSSFMENLAAQADSEAPRRIVKICLQERWRADVLYELFQHNISRASLFPGLDGFAQSLGTTVWSELCEPDTSATEKTLDGFPFK